MSLGAYSFAHARIKTLIRTAPSLPDDPETKKRKKDALPH